MLDAIPLALNMYKNQQKHNFTQDALIAIQHKTEPERQKRDLRSNILFKLW